MVNGHSTIELKWFVIGYIQISGLQMKLIFVSIMSNVINASIRLNKNIKTNVKISMSNILKIIQSTSRNMQYIQGFPHLRR